MLNKRMGQAGSVVFVILLALALIAVLAPLAGFRLDVVQSGSMSPAMGVGDLAVASPVRPEDIGVGDTIIFRSRDGGMLVCHRVIAVNESDGTFQTKGDANEDPDLYPVRPQDVVARVGVSIPVLGYAVGFMKSPWGWGLLIAIALILIFWGDLTGKDQKKDVEDK